MTHFHHPPDRSNPSRLGATTRYSIELTPLNDGTVFISMYAVSPTNRPEEFAAWKCIADARPTLNEALYCIGSFIAEYMDSTGKIPRSSPKPRTFATWRSNRNLGRLNRLFQFDHPAPLS
jgi:hypothetical protein